MAKAAGFELGNDLVLKDYHVRSVTLGEDAQGQVTVQCQLRGRTFRGQGVSTDTVEASALAFCDVINQCDSLVEQGQPQSGADESAKLSGI